MTSGEIWTVEESRNNLFAYIANRKNYKNWTREIFTSVEKKSLRANQIKEDYFPI